MRTLAFLVVESFVQVSLNFIQGLGAAQGEAHQKLIFDVTYKAK